MASRVNVFFDVFNW